MWIEAYVCLHIGFFELMFPVIVLGLDLCPLFIFNIFQWSVFFFKGEGTPKFEKCGEGGTLTQIYTGQVTVLVQVGLIELSFP